jgi:hypothetical protein
MTIDNYQLQISEGHPQFAIDNCQLSFVNPVFVLELRLRACQTSAHDVLIVCDEEKDVKTGKGGIQPAPARTRHPWLDYPRIAAL